MIFHCDLHRWTWSSQPFFCLNNFYFVNYQHWRKKHQNVFCLFYQVEYINIFFKQKVALFYFYKKSLFKRILWPLFKVSTCIFGIEGTSLIRFRKKIPSENFSISIALFHWTRSLLPVYLRKAEKVAPLSSIFLVVSHLFASFHF